ncbi:photoreceptor-specific nuclear receptor-like [Ornithodoros turicata]|uniref:photoreceptor-specific nuclear receptor-like n=1 Tax=Ornithodoros turicata TaxID=34597 RepID=UPI003138F775
MGTQETAAKLLFCTVRWIRGLPAYVHLCCRDQVLLLEASWSDVFLLSATQWGFPLLEGGCSDDAGNVAVHHATSLHVMRETMSHLASLQTDHTEFSCLKALALFRPETPGLRDASHVERVQEHTLTALMEHEEQKQSSTAGSGIRGARLLLLLTSLRSVASRFIEDAFFRSTIGPVPIERILCDVLQTL